MYGYIWLVASLLLIERAPVEGGRRNLANAENHVIACISAGVEILSKKESFYSAFADIILLIHIHIPHTHNLRHVCIQVTVRKPRVKSWTPRRWSMKQASTKLGTDHECHFLSRGIPQPRKPPKLLHQDGPRRHTFKRINFSWHMGARTGKTAVLGTRGLRETDHWCMGIVAKRTLVIKTALLGKCRSMGEIGRFTLLDVDVGGIPRKP